MQKQKGVEKDQEKGKQIARGKKTVLNLSSRRLSDDDFILLGKGLSFCPRSKSHDKIKLAEELFKYASRIRLNEFFAEDNLSNNTQKEQDSFSELPFFNRKQSSFTPPSGRDVYLDFYIEAISQELLQAEPKIISIAIFLSLNLRRFKVWHMTIPLSSKNLINQVLLLLWKKSDYIAEVERQLHNSEYYEN